MCVSAIAVREYRRCGFRTGGRRAIQIWMKASLVFLVLVLAACADNDSSRQTAADASDGGQDRLVEAGATDPRPSPLDDIIACGEPAAPQAALVGPALAQPQVLAAAQRAPSAVAVDSQNVYWLNSQLDGGVYKIAKSGSGAIVPLFEGALISSRSLLLDETSLYFSTGSEIRAVPIVGGQGRLVASGFAADLALLNGRIYWLEAQDRTTGNAVIKSVSISGGGDADSRYRREVCAHLHKQWRRWHRARPVCEYEPRAGNS